MSIITAPTQTIVGSLDAGFLPSPFDNPEIWNRLTINGITWGDGGLGGPGYVVVRRAKRAYKWDTKNPAAQVGQNQSFRGLEFPPFDLVFHFWDTTGWDAWQEFSDVFNVDPTKLAPGTAPPALNIFHPSLALLGISAIVVDDVGGVEQMNEGGEYRAVVAVREFKPVVAKSVNATPVLANNTIGEVGIQGVALTPAEVQANSQLALTQQAYGNGAALYQSSSGAYIWSPSQGGVPP
jgi:hypothetical protein